jgi:vitamin B12 transporter
MLRWYPLFLFISLVLDLPGQIDTVNTLPTAVVESYAIRKIQTGEQAQRWTGEQTSNFQNLSLPELLEKESGIYFKHYGGGSSATSSIRGASASQTAVRWNGLPIQSPMLGQLDFSLLPIGFIDEISLQYGGNSTAWGNGAIGGAIQLDSKLPVRAGGELTYQALLGSFGLSSHLLKAGYRKGAFASVSRLLLNRVDNDFEYSLGAGLPAKRLENAQVAQKSIMQEFFWAGKQGGLFSVHAWWQDFDREIPPTTVQSRSLAAQQDRTFRLAANWKKMKKQAVFNARLGAFQERQDYSDELIFLESTNQFWTLAGEIEAIWMPSSKQRLQLAAAHNWVLADANAYAERPMQNQTALMAFFRQDIKHLQIQLGGRLAVLDGALIPFTPSLGIDYSPISWFGLKARVNRSYRVPTLNDLYWLPGGNQNLKPEEGWSQELGLHFPFQWERGKIKYSITGFNRRINNWILWRPREGQVFWGAENLAEVWSRGIEQRLTFSQPIGKVHSQIVMGHNYVKSTNETDDPARNLLAGQQLVYVPESQFFSSLHLNITHWRFSYWHRYVSKVRAVNVEQLPAYHIGSAMLQYHINGKKWSARLFFQAENIWNVNYRIIERRPMPGRHYRIGLRGTLNTQQT